MKKKNKTDPPDQRAPILSNDARKHISWVEFHGGSNGTIKIQLEFRNPPVIRDNSCQIKIFEKILKKIQNFKNDKIKKSCFWGLFLATFSDFKSTSKNYIIKNISFSLKICLWRVSLIWTKCFKKRQQKRKKCDSDI